MEIERLNQRVHMHEGLPAFNAGEWPGSISSHWSDRGKIVLLPIRRENIILGEKERNNHSFGRKHYKPQISKELLFKPTIKMVKGKFTSLERKTGLKPVDTKFSEDKSFFSKRHFDERYGLDNSTIPFCIRTFEHNNNRSSNETSIEDLCGRKSRILSLTQMRNFYPEVSQGDKAYKNPQYTGNFFKDGGLIVGSTNKHKFNKNDGKKGNNFYMTLNVKENFLDPKKLWENKINNEEKEFQLSYVKNLNNWNKEIFKDKLKKIEETKGKVSTNNKQDKNKKK